MPRVLLLAVGLALAGCGGGDRQGVAVTEAEPVETIVPLGPRPTAPLDTVYADSALYADPRLDSLTVDSLAADSLAAERTAPDFRAFWPTFQRALREGREAVTPLVQVGDSGIPRSRFDDLYPAAFGEPFRGRVLGLTARDFRVRGVTRDVSVTVGYDADGAIVPEDEAVTEASVLLRFEPRDGAYRLVGLEIAG